MKQLHARSRYAAGATEILIQDFMVHAQKNRLSAVFLLCAY